MKTTRYELPLEGITLLGYIVRRMHKTAWLEPVPRMVAQGDTIGAIQQVAIYAALSSTSYGPAFYQPRSNATGEIISEKDPATGAMVSAQLDSRSPHYHISYEVIMPDGDIFNGSEEITGTTVGLRGLGMPAPSRFTFTSGGYAVQLVGTITSELALSLIGRTRIRAFGFLDFDDNAGNSGRLELLRSGEMKLRINGEEKEIDILMSLDQVESTAA